MDIAQAVQEYSLSCTYKRGRGINVPSSSPTTHLVLEMANVFIQGGIFNSAQGDFHFNNRDSESGTQFQAHWEEYSYR